MEIVQGAGLLLAGLVEMAWTKTAFGVVLGIVGLLAGIVMILYGLLKVIF